MPTLAIIILIGSMKYCDLRMLIALVIEDSEEASNGTVVRVLPLPTGRLESDSEVVLEVPLTVATTM
jgi:hypothetical protein